MPIHQNSAITAEMTVDTILEMYPNTAKVFIAHGTLCVGCWMSDFHTMTEVALLYRIKLDDLLDELQQVAEEKGSGDATIDTLDA